jgi:hypothetical protein
MAGNPWFVPKPRGYGAVPSGWQGWAVIGVAVAAMVVLAVLCFGDGAPTVGEIIAFILGDLVIVAVLVVVAKAKTDGEWRWRSGKEGER